MKSNDSTQSIAQKFMEETAHLTPEERTQVLDLLLKANETRKAREAATAAAPPAKPKTP
jgi:hypothetical protein